MTDSLALLLAASSNSGRALGFNKGMGYAQASRPFEEHPLHGRNVAQVYDMRLNEYDNLSFPLENMLPEFAAANDVVEQLKEYLGEGTEDTPPTPPEYSSAQDP